MKNVPDNEDMDTPTILVVCAALGCGVVICSCFACAITVLLLRWLGVV